MKTDFILIPLTILALTSIIMFFKSEIKKEKTLMGLGLNVSGFVVSSIMLFVIYILNK